LPELASDGDFPTSLSQVSGTGLFFKFLLFCFVLAILEFELRDSYLLDTLPLKPYLQPTLLVFDRVLVNFALTGLDLKVLLLQLPECCDLQVCTTSPDLKDFC
jgi:hypothetical protein